MFVDVPNACSNICHAVHSAFCMIELNVRYESHCTCMLDTNAEIMFPKIEKRRENCSEMYIVSHAKNGTESS